MQRIAAGAPVDEYPFTVATYGDRDRFHRRLAVLGTIAGPVVDVTAPQAVRAMVSMSGAGRVVRNVEAAMAAAERSGRTMPSTLARVARHGDTSVIVPTRPDRGRESSRARVGTPPSGGAGTRQGARRKRHRGIRHRSPPPAGHEIDPVWRRVGDAANDFRASCGHGITQHRCTEGLGGRRRLQQLRHADRRRRDRRRGRRCARRRDQSLRHRRRLRRYQERGAPRPCPRHPTRRGGDRHQVRRADRRRPQRRRARRTSQAPSKTACTGSVPTASTSTSSTCPTRAFRSTRPSARSTRSSGPARCARSARATSHRR